MFEKRKLYEIGEVVSGGTPRTSKEEYWNGEIPWITPKDLSSHEGRFISRGERNISYEGVKNSSAKILPKDTVLFTSRAPIGYIAIAKNEVTTNQGFKSIIANKNSYYSFIYYLLKNNIDYIKKFANGSTFQEVSGSVMKNIEFKIPILIEQKAIANILSTLDDKIEVNNQINKTLESMAQAIFKHWFIDFEFPNESGAPYKSSGGEMIESELGMIPKGWDIISLDKIIDIVNGYSYKGSDLNESNNAMVTIKNFDRNGGYKIDGLKEIILSNRVKKHHFLEINDVVVAHTDLTQGAEIIGNPVMILSKGKYEKLIMSMDVVKAVPKSEYVSNAFIYSLLKTNSFKQHALGYVNGTTVLHLSKKAIPLYNIPFPIKIDLCKKLSNILNNIMIRISLGICEKDNLVLLRDTLLPKLMSGEIRVPLNESGDEQ